MLDTIILSNNSIKNIFKIAHPKYLEYLYRKNYIGKSVSASANKNRKWRKNMETTRRRKDRKNTKKQINDID